MNKKMLLIAGGVIAAICLFLAFFVFMHRGGGRDVIGIFDSMTGAAFKKYGFTEDSVVRSSVKERQVNGVWYQTTMREYEAPPSFKWKKFTEDLENAIRKSRFYVISKDRTASKKGESCTISIVLDKRHLMNIQVNKGKPTIVQPVEPPKEAPVYIPPPEKIVKKVKSPKVAIVLDDFGYRTSSLDQLFSIGEPVTLSILPRHDHSRDVAEMAHKRGYEVILHLPLEAHRKDAGEEVATIRSGMTKHEILPILIKDIAAVPNITGVSNHQGSKGTEDEAVMSVIIEYLKTKGLYFFDSVTSQHSVCKEIAREKGVRFAKRDVFIDNSSDPEAIENQLDEVSRLAFRRGKAIAIGHDRNNTIAALARKMPEMAREGIEFVYLSEMER